jgi:hypothetical protein
MALSAQTPVLTDKSGWSATAKITNHTGHDVAAGTVEVFFSTISLTTASRVQSWAEGVPFSTPVLLLRAAVPQLKSGHSHDVKLTADPSDAHLALIRTWGVKPLLVRYTALSTSGTVIARIHTFVTRSRAGLPGTQTPALTVTPVLPVTAAHGWTVRAGSLSKLVRTPAASQEVLTQTARSRATTANAERLIAQNPSLQTVVDPLLLRSLMVDHSPVTQSSESSVDIARSLYQHATGLMQPGHFDISARALAGTNGWPSATKWTDAGIGDHAWASSQDASLTAGLAEPHTSNAGGSNAHDFPTSSLPHIAWESHTSWSRQALELAAKEGYTTVIADSAQPSPVDATVRSSRLDISTSAGTVRVLAAQGTLSSLAQGVATSDKADGEKNDAGRLARFVAQSAVDQMQLPYKNRNILVSLSPNVHFARDSELLSVLGSCDWLTMGRLSDFSSLPAAEAAQQGTTAQLGQRHAVSASAFTSALDALAKTNAEINRINQWVLLPDTSETENKEQADNPQPLARQNAKPNAEDTVSQTEWVNKLRTAHRLLALGTIASLETTDSTPRDSHDQSHTHTALTRDDASLAHLLSTAVTIATPSHINIFSETARTPITVTNNLPYRVCVRLTAHTDTAALSISGARTLHVAATSEGQTTFMIHVIGAMQAVATLSVLDRVGTPLSKPVHMNVYSQLTLNDMSGNILIIIAVIFGGLGFYRQFHKKKDPDQ